MAEKLEVKGKIKLIGELQSFDSGFTKRELVITTEDKFPQDIKLEFMKDNCAKLDAYNVDDDVTVGFNLRGSEYNGKYYVSLSAWKIDKAEAF